MLLNNREIEVLNQKLKTASEERKRSINILLSLAREIPEKQICEQFKVHRKTVERLRLLAEAGKASQIESYLRGRPSSTTSNYLDRLDQLLKRNPKEFGFAFTNWTAGSLAVQLRSEFDIELTARRINQILNEQGLSLRSL